MSVLWNAAYPGIFIEGSSTRVGGRQMGMMEGQAFISATRTALSRIASKPVGKDLLTLISKRCQGVGTKLKGGQCIIYYGTGTLTEGRVDFAKALLSETHAGATDSSGRDRTGKPVKVITDNGPVAIPGLTMAGTGSSAFVSYNPFGNYADTTIVQGKSLRMILGVDMPAYVALAHELIHAFHTLSGNRKPERPNGKAPLEEAWTVGAGKYANTRISENAIRAEHNLERRLYYFSPGDCA